MPGLMRAQDAAKKLQSKFPHDEICLTAEFHYFPEDRPYLWLTVTVDGKLATHRPHSNWESAIAELDEQLAGQEPAELFGEIAGI